MTTYIANGFSLNMIAGKATIIKEPITKEEFLEACKTGKSIIGHPEIAKMFGVELNREHVSLKYGDTIYVVSPCIRSESERYIFVDEETGYCYSRAIIWS